MSWLGYVSFYHNHTKAFFTCSRPLFLFYTPCRSSRQEENKIHRKTPMPGPQACSFIKNEALVQMLQIFKNIFFYRTPLMAVSMPPENITKLQVYHREY